MIRERADNVVGDRRRAPRGGSLRSILGRGAVFGDLTVKFILPDAEFHSAALFLVDCGQGRAPSIRRGRDCDLSEFRRVTLIRLERGGGQEGRAGRPGQGREAAVQHRDAQLLHDILTALRHAVRVELGRSGPGDQHVEWGARLDQHLGFGLSGRNASKVRFRSRRSDRLPIPEAGLDLGFDSRWVEIAHHDQDRAFRAIVAVIEVSNLADRRLFQDVDLSDRNPVRHQLVREKEAQAIAKDTEPRRVAGAFFGQDDTAFMIHRRLGQGQFRSDLAHEFQRDIQGLIVRLGQVQLVDGLVEIGGRVGVGAEGKSVALENLDHLVFRNRLGALERHVFKEVRQAGLRVGLHQGAGVDAEADRRLASGDRLPLDRIAQPIGQGAEANVGVGGHVGLRLWPNALWQLYEGGRRRRSANIRQAREVRQGQGAGECGARDQERGGERQARAQGTDHRKVLMSCETADTIAAPHGDGKAIRRRTRAPRTLCLDEAR